MNKHIRFIEHQHLTIRPWGDGWRVLDNRGFLVGKADKLIDAIDAARIARTHGKRFFAVNKNGFFIVDKNRK